MSRSANFIDGAYIDFTLRDEFGKVKISYARLAQAMTPANKELLRTYHYLCPPYQSNPATAYERQLQAKFDAFQASLLATPRYQVRQGVLARRVDALGNVRYEQKRVDILLGVDLVKLAATHQITEAVLLAGDSDFLPAIEVAKNDGVLIRVYHGRSPHRALLQMADECHQIDQAFIDSVRI